MNKIMSLLLFLSLALNCYLTWQVYKLNTVIDATKHVPNSVGTNNAESIPSGISLLDFKQLDKLPHSLHFSLELDYSEDISKRIAIQVLAHNGEYFEVASYGDFSQLNRGHNRVEGFIVLHKHQDKGFTQSAPYVTKYIAIRIRLVDDSNTPLSQQFVIDQTINSQQSWFFES